MRTKELENRIAKLEEIFIQYKQNIKNRDYLIRTNFVGELKNKDLIAILKKSLFDADKEKEYSICKGYSFFMDISGYSENFETVKQEIIDYKFDRMKSFLDKLKSLVSMQEELEDVRGAKQKAKATVKKSSKPNGKTKKLNTKKVESK